MYLRERMAASDDEARTKAIYEGLLDVIEPSRRAARLQREMAGAAKSAAAAASKAERDRRAALILSERFGRIEARRA